MGAIEPPPASGSTWAAALGLEERRDLLSDGLSVPPADAARVEAWRQEMLVDAELFGQRLAAASLSRDDFARLLAVEPGTLLVTEPPWMARVEALLVPPRPRDGSFSVEVPFRGLLRPLLAGALVRLQREVDALHRRFGLASPIFAPSALTDLLSALTRRLIAYCSPTLILELNVARLRGELPGDSGEARLRYFSEVLLAEPARRRTLLGEYPVLARQLALAVDQWVSASGELVERFLADRELLAGHFGGEPGVVHAVDALLSDPHRGARSVMRLELSGCRDLVYKPKSLRVDARFGELLAWLGERGLRHPHRPLRVVDRGEYGWTEFVAAAPCADREAGRRFYWREGSLLALLHLLHAVDFHHENLIAAGEHPVLVDLESLFHHRWHDALPETAHTLARRFLEDSVISVGLLPVLTWGKEGGRGVDLSGMGARGGDQYPHPVAQVVDGGTDTMRIEKRPLSVRPSHNLPVVEGIALAPTDHVEDIVAGFTETWALLAAEPAAFAVRLEAFSDVDVRYIPRATARYSAFLQEGLHPDYLRDGLDRDRLFDKLWAEVEVRPELRSLVAAEQADLRSGDVPIFTGQPASRDLWDSRSRRVADFFTAPVLDNAREDIARLNESTCAAQVDLIRKSMLAIDVASPQPTAGASPGSEDKAAAPDAKALISAATAIGEHLAAGAFRGPDDVTWTGVTLHSEGQWQWVVAPLEVGLYQGVAGVGLFLACLAELTGREDFSDLALRCAPPLLRHLASHEPEGFANVGAYSGRASLLYVLSHLAAMWRRPELLAEALESLPELSVQVECDRGLDLMSGVAGCAVVLLDLHRQTGDGRLLKLARRCGERLRATAVAPVEGGAAWISTAAAEPLAGFSHGAAGIAWALLRLADACGEPAFGDLAQRALDFERALFLPEASNWMDRRRFKEAPPDFRSTAWCHGAPGVALARLLSLPLLDDAKVRGEIAVGLAETVRSGFGGNHSLCHGDLGNLDILLLAAARTGDERWRQEAFRQAARVCDEAVCGVWRCGLPRHQESPGLMIGLAGIGYGLLRLAAPERVPGVLWLEPAGG